MSIIGSRYYSNRPLKSFRLCLRSDQKDPLELVQHLKLGPDGLKRLAKESRIEEHSLLAIVKEERQKSRSDQFRPPIRFIRALVPRKELGLTTGRHEYGLTIIAHVPVPLEATQSA